MPRIAVVLLNLGGPDSTAAIRPFLINFFTDPNIIRAPYPVRFLVSRMIAYRRSKKEAGISYGLLGGKSPLLENTQAQAAALEAELNKNAAGHEFKTFIAMRYWHPMSAETAAAVQAYAPDQIILLPLYPQYSTTTTRSSLQAWQQATKKLGLTVPSSLVCCYPRGSGFIQASADNVKTAYATALAETSARGLPAPRVLFSAHGLPENIVKDGDPYQWQCEEGARLIATATGIENLDWQICYQSRVGPLKWLGPSTEDALHKAAHDKVPVVVYPHAFVSEHVETLVEIEQEYREVAHELGVPYFARVPTVSVAAPFITGLADAVTAQLGKVMLAPDEGKRLCPAGFKNCCMQEFSQGV